MPHSSSHRVDRWRKRQRAADHSRKEAWLHKNDWKRIDRILRKENAVFPNHSQGLSYIIGLAEKYLELSTNLPSLPRPASKITGLKDRLKKFFSFFSR